ncbi:type II toxin-antitoxin system RelE/ParE family toxin [Leptolyngbya sp. AN03gr2]|uniref:type II toxin-antitoxin system RelE/ParE family toxin n=1 Tax=unclassified Leptolyngbya TaxID=2650499 RepID=UPI003D32164B
MSQYVISDEAIWDLNDISDYFLQTNVEAGEQFLIAFNTKCQQLVSFPNIGRSYAHIRPDLRGLALRGFIILYRVSEINGLVRIEILRVVSGRRNLEALF